MDQTARTGIKSRKGQTGTIKQTQRRNPFRNLHQNMPLNQHHLVQLMLHNGPTNPRHHTLAVTAAVARTTSACLCYLLVLGMIHFVFSDL